VKRVLDPIDRVSEILFGLIMVLTFTGSLSVAEAGAGDVRDMLVGALGCNLAWAIIDALFYLMGCLSERGNEIRTLRAVRAAANPEEARDRIAEALPPVVADTLAPADYELIRGKLAELPEPPARPPVRRDDLLGAGGVFLLVFLTTFPVAVPFLMTDDLARAMRWSNGVAVVLLFAAGFAFGRTTGYRPWLSGLAMVVAGLVIVALTIALGG
jgi:hypothetical protein